MSNSAIQTDLHSTPEAKARDGKSIPSGWERVELGRLISERKQKVVPTPDDDRPYIALEHIAQGEPMLVGQGIASDATSTKTAFKAGDILFGKLRPNLRKCVRVDFDGVCSTDILAFYAKDGHDPKFLLHLIASHHVTGYAARTAIGTKMPRTSWPVLAEYPVLAPPPPEQKRIGEILASVDKAIEKTRDVIEQTRNLKTALLQDLLTHGLPGKHTEFVKHKNLGTIPTAWDVVKLDSLIDPARPVCYGILMPGTGHPGGIPVVKVKDIMGGLVKSDGLLLTTPELDEEYRRSRLKGGDLLLSIRGSTGRVGIVPDKLTGANITQDTARLACLDNIIRDWLYYILQGHELQSYVQQHTIGQAVKGINIAEVRRIPIPLPGEHERKQIVDLFHAVEARINTESDRLKRLVRSKTALSQALLMGRVRITNRSEITDANT